MPDSRWKLISICTLCEEGDPRRKSRSNLWSIFLSTPSARRATERPIRQALELSISIHALREEGDPRRKSRSNLWSIFLSTPSVRRATPSRHFLLRADAYFYPRPPRGGRQPGLAGRKDISYFYPRPPRGGRRLGQTGRATQFPISIYALREEGDRTLTGKWPKARAFLSTPSARRATLQCLVTWSSHRYFYPRPPRGGRPDVVIHQAYCCVISIHALREEGDSLRPSDRRGAPDISIHALREEGDNALSSLMVRLMLFLSTPSARRATSLPFRAYAKI